jgi:UDP-N-acetylglucosamine 2-epimerase (non-hydrolysing)
MNPSRNENPANAAVPAKATRIAIVVGARPNFMKAAPIIRAIHGHNQESGHSPIEHLLVHTGQHYDEAMSDRFFTDLGLPQPDVHLGVGSGSHAVQTAEIMKKFEQVLLDKKPDVVVVVGDVNSTVGCALVTAKISFDSAGHRPLIAHVEAGLRSFDRTMPEEINRIVTDHLSDLLFVTEESGLDNLRREGISQGKIHFVGNTMIDSLLAFQEKAESSAILEKLGFRSHAAGNGTKSSVSPYALLTLHRPANVDNRDSFQNILGGLEDLAKDRPIVFPVHPRTRQRMKDFGLDLDLPAGAGTENHNAAQAAGNRKGVILVDPLGYLDFLCLMKHASIVVTDSGGIQEETTCLGVPCVTVRENTERPATVKQGSNVVAGTSKNGIKEAIRNQMARRGSSGVPKNWDGRAAERIIDILSTIGVVGETSAPRLIPQSCV